MKASVPGRWDGASDITVHLLIALGDAEDIGDRFQLRLNWEHTQEEEPLSVASNPVDVETIVLAGRVAQYDTYRVTFTIDYDIDGAGDEIQPHEVIGMQLYRIAATANEVDTDIIVLDWHMHYDVDKMFQA